MSFSRTNNEYQKWINHPRLDQELKQLLLNADEEELNSAFNLELEFGTAGIRGILGAGPGRFNQYTIKKVTLGLISFLKSKYSDNKLSQGVVIGHDNRHNSQKFALLAAEILTSYGIAAYLFDQNQMMPTPVVSFATKKIQAIAGIVITASHNPAQYNGYKIYDSNGCQLSESDTSSIAQFISQISDILDWEFIPEPQLLRIISKNICDQYDQMIADLQFYPTQKRNNFKIIFSAVNGTGSLFTPRLLRDFGYQVIEVAEHQFEDPTFVNVGNPNPEFSPAWKFPLEYAQRENADLIIINDPDADRIGVAVKNELGDWIRLNGNETGPLLIDWKLSQLTKFKKMPKNPALYSSFVTSNLGDRIANETYGVQVIKTLTGFKWMGGEILKESQRNLNFVFAYEESFGYVLDNSTLDKDGIQAAIVFSELAWYMKEHKKQSIIETLDILYQKYGFYYTNTLNLNVKPEEKSQLLDPIMLKLRTKGLPELGNIKTIKMEDYIDGLYNMPGQDLMKFYFEGGSWIAIRPSGTEPKLKIYFVIKDKNKTEALKKYQIMELDLKNKLEINL